jgi:hypothetical protein
METDVSEIKPTDVVETTVPPLEVKSVDLSEQLERLKDVNALSEGAKRNFYWQMKAICFGGGNELNTRNVGKDWQMIPDKKDHKSGQSRSFYLVKYLGYDHPGSKTFEDKREEMRSPRLEFHFTLAANDEVIAEEEKSLWAYGPRIYTTKNIYHFDKARIGNGPLHPAWTEHIVAGREEGTGIELNENFQHDTTSGFDQLIDPAKLQSAIDELTKPEETFQDQAKIIVEAARDKKIPPEAAKRLIQAIREFGNYMYQKSDDHNPTHFIDDCGLKSTEFNIFCAEKFGIKIDEITPIAHLPPEELFAGGEREPLSSTHILNACGVLGIDWTARQYGGELPFPEVFRLDQIKKKYYINATPTFKPSIIYVPRPPEELLIKD